MQNASAAPAALLSPVASSASRQTGANTSPATAEEPTDLPPPPSEAVTLAAFHEIFTTLARSSTRNSSDESLSGGGNTERNQILTLLAQKACLLTNCASAVVALLDAGRDSVEFVAAWGTDAADIVGFHVRANDTLAGNTARTGEPYWAFRDGSNEPADGSITNDPKFPVVYSAAVLPLFVGGVSTGAVAALHKKNYQPFDGADLMTLSTLAAAASVVVSSHAGQAERAQQGRELAVLYEAVRNVSGALSAPEVLRVVVEQVAGQMESSAVVVWLMNEERTHLTIAEDEGLTPDEREITLPSNETGGPTRWVSDLLRQAKPAFLYFVDEDEFAPPAPMPSASPHDFWTCESPFPALSARSGLACPIRSGDAVRGFVLVLSGQKPGVYETSDAKLLSALASQAAVALENADLYEDATRRAEEAAVLYELSQAVTSTLHLPDVLDRVAEAVLNLLLVDKFALFLHDPPTDRLLIKNSRNLSPGAAERIAPLVGQGIPGWVMEFETPTAVLDVAADHRNASAPLQNEGVASLIGMPLQIGATTMGVLCAMTTRRRSFTVSEMELAYTIANQAALAIENARIYENVRQKGLEVRKYFGRIARALNSSQSPDEVPRLIVSLTQEVMESDRCALFAVHSEGNDENEAERILEWAASSGFRTEAEDAGQQTQITSPNTPAGWIVQNNHPLYVENLDTDDRFSDNYDRPAQGRAAGYLGVPLRSAGRVVGVLEVTTRRRRLWRGDEVRLLLTFASQAAVAFQNAQLGRAHARSESRARCLEKLLALSTRNEVTPDALVAALAIGLNAPIVVLQHGKKPPVWQIAAASVAADTIPLSVLQTALTPRESEGASVAAGGFSWASAPTKSGGRVAAVVLDAPVDKTGTHALLRSAVSLLTAAQSMETPGAIVSS